MAAPNLPTLYDFETQIESVWVSVMSTAFSAQLPAASVQVIGTRDASIDQTPRLEVELHVGNVLRTRRGVLNGSYREIPIAFTGTLRFRLISTRPYASHGMLRGIVRSTVSASANVITSSNLPYLQILEILPSSSTPQIYDEKAQDITEMDYAIQFAIKNEAWPS